LKNTPFRPISASGSNFNPQNTPCIPAVEIFSFLKLKRNWAFFKGLVSGQGRLPDSMLIQVIAASGNFTDSSKDIRYHEIKDLASIKWRGLMGDADRSKNRGGGFTSYILRVLATDELKTG
jgi:hypothetical protein